MDIQKEKKAIKNLKAFYMEDWNLTEEERDDLDNLVSRIVAVVKTEAQAVPETQQALNDRLLVKSIREHVESHIAEIRVNDLFDKGWLAAMKCIQNNIDMLEAQAAPEGFVLVKMDDLELLRDSALKIKHASLSNDSDRIFSDIEDIQLSVERLIELQEPTNG